jgi:hypothetical protein
MSPSWFVIIRFLKFGRREVTLMSLVFISCNRQIGEMLKMTYKNWTSKDLSNNNKAFAKLK